MGMKLDKSRGLHQAKKKERVISGADGAGEKKSGNKAKSQDVIKQSKFKNFFKVFTRIRSKLIIAFMIPVIFIIGIGAISYLKS